MTLKELQQIFYWIDDNVPKHTQSVYDENTGDYGIIDTIYFNDLMERLAQYPVDGATDIDVKVAYICDRFACKDCSYPTCSHTTNIVHAKNFKALGCDNNIESRYFEEYPYVDEHEFNCEHILKNTEEESD